MAGSSFSDPLALSCDPSRSTEPLNLFQPFYSLLEIRSSRADHFDPMRTAEHHQNMLARMRREFRRKYCLHPDAPRGCSDKIVGAHTVQRAMLEKFIAQDGHVGQIRITSHFDEEHKIQGLLAKPDPVGLNKATVFAGFCKAHDNDLFRPLENSPFNFQPKQIVLLGYRAICREVYGRDAEIASADAMRNYAAVNPDTWGFAEKDARHEILRLGQLNARANPGIG